MTASDIIRQAFKRSGINSDLAICQEIGFDYKKFHFRRMNNPGTLTLNELWLLQRHTTFTDEEILGIAKFSKENEPHSGRNATHLEKINY